VAGLQRFVKVLLHGQCPAPRIDGSVQRTALAQLLSGTAKSSVNPDDAVSTWADGTSRFLRRFGRSRSH
jgi:hypothetical protein